MDRKALIETPCEIGSYVYTIHRKKVRKWEVVGMWLSIESDYNAMHLSWYKDKDNFQTISVPFSQIGKSVFLYEDEAAKEIKRLKVDIKEE